MKISYLTTSLVALTLFVSPVLAQEQDQIAPAGQTAAAVLPAALQAILDDSRPASELSNKELAQRIRLAKKFMALDGLPADVKQSLQVKSKEARAEFATRQQAGEQPPQDQGDASAEAQTDTAAGAAGGTNAGTNVAPDQPAEEVLPIATQLPDDVLAYLQDDRAAQDLSLPDLKARVASGRAMMGRDGLPEDASARLAGKFKSDRNELATRSTADEQTPPEGSNDQTAGGAEPIVEPGQGNGQITEPGQEVGQPIERADVNPVSEEQARALLADSRPPETRPLPQLRQRVAKMRKLIQEDRLSLNLKPVLYRQFIVERDVLRARMAAENGGTTANPAQKPIKPGTTGGGQPGIDVVNKYVNDRRPPDQLDDNDLKLRINIFVYISNDQRYSYQDRLLWQERLQRDREQLRIRLLRERAQREARLRQLNNEDIVLNEGQAPIDDLAEAEADQLDLENALAAPPRRKFTRRYSIQDFESSADLRAAVPRIEIDTIHFGFNESFVREEEVGNLDRVAEIMEKIISAHPREIFLIEGHTDASGSDGYNLGLSRLRAAAVMQALTTYYVIPARNLRTVGYGERYLKIPVDGPEAENRRVSVSRVTDALNESAY